MKGSQAMEKYKDPFPPGATLCVFSDNNLIFTSNGKWLHPIFNFQEFLNSHPEAAPAGAVLSAHDAAVGKAAAVLMKQSGIKRIHADLASQLAIDFARSRGIEFSYERLVEHFKCSTEAELAPLDDDNKMQLLVRHRYEILKQLENLSDKEYAKFQAKLTPTVNPSLFIGVRVPKVRALAKEFCKKPEHTEFLSHLPHRFYDENMLHGLLISEIKDYNQCITELEKFLPYVDNWAVCDIMSPKAFRKNKDKLLVKIKKWIKSKHTYTCRFAIEMLMSHYLDDDFKPEYLKIPAGLRSDEYYLNMMIAWFFATALAKQWDATIPYISRKQLGEWVLKKTIRKSCESFRITQEHKEYLKKLFD